MSVYVNVGWLDQMRSSDEEGFAHYQRFFENVTQMLQQKNLPSYVEPADLLGRGRSWQVFPSNGIAHLQRLAVYLWKIEEWPTPGSENMGNPLADQQMESAYEDCYIEARVPNSQGQRFNHLVCHSSRDGYWLPVEFDPVLVENKVEYGSALRLMRELEEIARILNLPLSLDPTNRDVQARLQSATGTSRWEKYRIESYNCLALYHAARASQELGAAIHLH
ncbi:MAG: hypothetical protein MUD01_13615 [Chloroflexaceae bacterium]|jgi:hypothetical protein|nr:hypothetical protein [Chloroflexaceae bacterium]